MNRQRQKLVRGVTSPILRRVRQFRVSQTAKEIPLPTKAQEILLPEAQKETLDIDYYKSKGYSVRTDPQGNTIVSAPKKYYPTDFYPGNFPDSYSKANIPSSIKEQIWKEYGRGAIHGVASYVPEVFRVDPQGNIKSQQTKVRVLESSSARSQQRGTYVYAKDGIVQKIAVRISGKRTRLMTPLERERYLGRKAQKETEAIEKKKNERLIAEVLRGERKAETVDLGKQANRQIRDLKELVRKRGISTKGKSLKQITDSLQESIIYEMKMRALAQKYYSKEFQKKFNISAQKKRLQELKEKRVIAEAFARQYGKLLTKAERDKIEKQIESSGEFYKLLYGEKPKKFKTVGEKIEITGLPSYREYLNLQRALSPKEIQVLKRASDIFIAYPKRKNAVIDGYLVKREDLPSELVNAPKKLGIKKIEFILKSKRKKALLEIPELSSSEIAKFFKGEKEKLPFESKRSFKKVSGLGVVIASGLVSGVVSLASVGIKATKFIGTKALSPIDTSLTAARKVKKITKNPSWAAYKVKTGVSKAGKSIYREFTLDPVGTVAEFYAFSKALGMVTSTIGKSKIAYKVKKELFIHKAPKELRKPIREIFKGIESQKGFKPINIKSIKKVNFFNVQELTRAEAIALKKTLKQVDTVIFGSKAGDVLSKGQFSKIKKIHDVDLATKSLKNFIDKFMANLPKSARKNLIAKGEKIIRKGTGGTVLDVKPLARILPGKSVITGKGYLPVAGFTKKLKTVERVKEVIDLSKKILKEKLKLKRITTQKAFKAKSKIISKLQSKLSSKAKNIKLSELPKTERKIMQDALSIPTESFIKVGGVKFVSFSEQTTRKGLGTLQVLIEKNVRRAKDPQAFVGSLEIQLKAMKAAKVINPLKKIIIKNKIRTLEEALKYLKSPKFSKLLAKQVPGVKDFPILTTKKGKKVLNKLFLDNKIPKTLTTKYTTLKEVTKKSYLPKKIVKKTPAALAAAKRKIPSKLPSRIPSKLPSKLPRVFSVMPSVLRVSYTPFKTKVSRIPSKLPSRVPSKLPSNLSQLFSKIPSTIKTVSRFPSKPPSKIPSKVPSKIPPSKPPSKIPPSKPPSKLPPSILLSKFPSKIPSRIPSKVPSKVPSRIPAAIRKKLIKALPPKREREKKIKKLIKKAIKAKEFIYLPDLYSIIMGIKAPKKKKVILLKKGRIFTGLEARPIV